MIPFIVLGPLRIPTYGLMLASAAILATWMAEMEFRRKRLSKNAGWDSGVVAIILGLIGARVNFLIEHPELVKESFGKALLSGAGLTWYGGFALGLAGVIVFWRIRKVGLLDGLDAVAPALALGYAIGRIGCQLSGDGDYGRASSLPWAMSYPHGLVPTFERVHPTPIYEILLMGGLFAFLWVGRRKAARGAVFALYLAGQGIERFIIEFFRRNPPLLLGLTEAQLVSMLMAVFGAGMLLWLSRTRPAPETDKRP
jgi:phosphatidylglycerol:prolipoprotein diacylglycerol transferase